MQKILELREFEKKQAQAELGKAVAEETRIQNELDTVAQERIKNIQAGKGITDFATITAINRYVSFLDLKKEGLLQELVQAQLATEQRREAMKTAMVKVDVLEKLKDNRRQEWGSENKKAEAKELDDINNSRFGR